MGLSWQTRVCHDKHTELCLSRQIFVATKICLLWQFFFFTTSILLLGQNMCFVICFTATNTCLSHQTHNKHMFDMTKLLSQQKSFFWQLPPVIHIGSRDPKWSWARYWPKAILNELGHSGSWGQKRSWINISARCNLLSIPWPNVPNLTFSFVIRRDLPHKCP